MSSHPCNALANITMRNPQTKVESSYCPEHSGPMILWFQQRFGQFHASVGVTGARCEYSIVDEEESSFKIPAKDAQLVEQFKWQRVQDAAAPKPKPAAPVLAPKVAPIPEPKPEPKPAAAAAPKVAAPEPPTNVTASKPVGAMTLPAASAPEVAQAGAETIPPSTPSADSGN